MKHDIIIIIGSVYITAQHSRCMYSNCSMNKLLKVDESSYLYKQTGSGNLLHVRHKVTIMLLVMYNDVYHHHLFLCKSLLDSKRSS